MNTTCLNPVAALSPMVGMFLNCIFGGKGVGMINMLLYVIIGIFVAGQMVGRTPEYLGKKIGAREVKLAVLALLVHPISDSPPHRANSQPRTWDKRQPATPVRMGFRKCFINSLQLQRITDRPLMDWALPMA